MTLKPYYKIIRFLFSIALIYLIIRKIDYGILQNILKHIRIHYVFLALFIFFIHDIIKAAKWYILLGVGDVKVPFLKLIQLDYASRFMGLFIPSGIGVDLLRGYGLSREMTSVNLAASSIIIDRIINLISLLIITSLSSLLSYKVIDNPSIAYGSLFILTCVLIIIFILSKDYSENVFDRLNKTTKKNKLLLKIGQLYQSLKEYKQHKKKILFVFILSLITQFFRITIYYFVNISVNAQISYKYCMIFTPIVILIAMLPLSLLGIGLREGSFVYFYTKIGISPSAAFSIPAIVSIMVILSVIPGGLILGIKGLVIKKDGMGQLE